jgi:hypothetical protein
LFSLRLELLFSLMDAFGMAALTMARYQKKHTGHGGRTKY